MAVISSPPDAPKSLRKDPEADRYFGELRKWLFKIANPSDSPPDGYLFSSPNKSVYAIRFNDDGSAYTELLQGADGSGTGTISVTP